MSNELQGAFARRIAGAYGRVVFPLTLRRITLFSPKASVARAIGDTTISLNALPAGMDRVKVNDTFSAGGGATKTISAETLAVGGVITNVPFSPALTAAITAASTVQINRYTFWTVKGYTRQYGASELVGGITQGDGEAFILATSIPADYGNPRAGDTCFDRFGRTGNVQQVTYEADLGFWKLQVRGW